jgi:hypothetical protein
VPCLTSSEYLPLTRGVRIHPCTVLDPTPVIRAEVQGPQTNTPPPRTRATWRLVAEPSSEP